MKIPWFTILQIVWRYGVVSCLVVYTIVKLSGDVFFGSKPTPAVPPEGYVVHDSNVRLAWSPGENVATFHLQVAENGDFSKLAFSSETTENSAELTTLAAGKRYCWRVNDDAGARVSCFYTSKTKIHY